jgi:hypothetical protein
MGHVHQVNVDGTPIKGLYAKSATEGDAYRFVTAEAGAAQMIHRLDTTVLGDGRQRVTPGSGSGVTWRDFVLAFPYLVAVNQLEVHIMSSTSMFMMRLPNRLAVEAARQSWVGWPSAFFDPASSAYTFFEEISYDTVRVYNIPSGYDVIHFSLPATSLQGSVRERLQVRDQSDNVGIELLGNGNGIILRSENGKRALLRMDDEFGLGLDPI